jgi:hypothetical protein
MNDQLVIIVIPLILGLNVPYVYDVIDRKDKQYTIELLQAELDDDKQRDFRSFRFTYEQYIIPRSICDILDDSLYDRERFIIYDYGYVIFIDKGNNTVCEILQDITVAWR